MFDKTPPGLGMASIIIYCPSATCILLLNGSSYDRERKEATLVRALPRRPINMQHKELKEGFFAMSPCHLHMDLPCRGLKEETLAGP